MLLFYGAYCTVCLTLVHCYLCEGILVDELPADVKIEMRTHSKAPQRLVLGYRVMDQATEELQKHRWIGGRERVVTSELVTMTMTVTMTVLIIACDVRECGGVHTV